MTTSILTTSPLKSFPDQTDQVRETIRRNVEWIGKGIPTTNDATAVLSLYVER